MYEKTAPVVEKILALELGEGCSFPLAEIQRIRNIVSLTGLRHGRTFTTKSNRNLHAVTVTRTS
ncbi:MAG: hypothetical protein IKX22_12130 [Prevotella sp.]|nr:hypothetical protein [Prevotella sp.]